jgi:pimeloyl-ACP methyl ester carboxylesterase
MKCTGTGSPTVLFEAGAGGGTEAFDFVAPEIEERTTVCRYDRAGIGQSDMRPEDASPASAGDVADELERLLAAGGVEGPFVLVAHSFGGMVAQLFADRHRGDVVGLVFDDSSLAAQVTDDLKTWEDGWRGGLLDMQRTKVELEATRPYGETPMVVLTQNFADTEEYDKSQQRWWRRHQAALARRSTNSIHLIAIESGHVIQDQQPDLVVAAIDEVVDAVRQGEPLALCDARFRTVGGVCIGQAPPP